MKTVSDTDRPLCFINVQITFLVMVPTRTFPSFTSTVVIIEFIKNNIPLIYSLVNLTYRVAVVIGILQNIKNVSHSDDWSYCNGVFRHYLTYRQVMQLHQLTNTYHRSCTGGVSKVGVLLFNF